MDRLYKELQEFGDVHLKRPLARYTTFKVGGPADRLIDVTDTDKLAKLLNFLTGRGVDYFILGGGSNVLLPDNGLRGVVIRVRTNKVDITGNTIRAEAGVMFASLVTTSIAHKLTGLEWAAGLPGTVGGAVRGNAGAMGGDVSQIISKVLVWQDGDVLELTPKECDFAYRDSVFKHGGGVVLAAWFELAPGDPLTSLKHVQEIIKQRSGHYPPYPSGGSFFKNVLLKDWPKNGIPLPSEFVAAGRVPAGWLSEQAELKGFQVGGAMVSEEHGNFLINRHDATQEDVLAVVEEVKTRVYTKFGVELEEEVHIIH
jgi:UDP-N-acetylmuramate dehydrogenase